jgi:hypothetical protein
MPGRRMKTYSAESGYVFEYALAAEPSPGTYDFEVSWDRKLLHLVKVVFAPEELLQAPLDTLNSVERYAVAKLAMRMAFDRCETPEALLRGPVRPERKDLDEILRTLDLL